MVSARDDTLEHTKPRAKLPVIKRPTKVRNVRKKNTNRSKRIILCFPLYWRSYVFLSNSPSVALLYQPSRTRQQKKPKDKPKRPLSAYNFFFKEEREKIIKVVLAEDPSAVKQDPDDDGFLDEETIGRLKKEGGKVSFEEMGK